MLDLQPEDGGWHPQIAPNYVEWWYVDALLNDDLCLSGSFGLWGDVRAVERLHVRSDFQLLQAGGTIINFGETVRGADFQAAVRHCDVSVGRGCFSEEEGEYALHIEADQAALDLTLTPLCSGYRYRYQFDDNRDSHLSWAVAIPQAAANGVLCLEGHQTRLTGNAYHDHNWASVSLSERIQSWQWGRLHSKHNTLIFAEVIGLSGNLFHGLAWIEHVRGESHYRYLHFDRTTSALELEKACNGWQLSFVDRDLCLHLTLHRKRLLLSRREPSNYQRFLSFASGRILLTQEEKTIDGWIIHEFQGL